MRLPVPVAASAPPVLAARGYRLAASTIDTSDYGFDQSYRYAAGNGALRRRIEKAHLDCSRVQIRYDAALNRQVLQREPPAVMALHLNALNAATLDRLLRAFRSEDYGFASLDAVQSEDAYRVSLRAMGRCRDITGRGSGASRRTGERSRSHRVESRRSRPCTETPAEQKGPLPSPEGGLLMSGMPKRDYFASSAVLATVLPADETSLPAPSIVLQALTASAAATTANPMILRMINLPDDDPRA